MGEFVGMMERLAAEAPDTKAISIDATDFKAHRTASNFLVNKGGVDICEGEPKAA